MSTIHSIRQASIKDITELSKLFDLYRQFYERNSHIEQSTKFIEERLINKDALIYISKTELGSTSGFCLLYPSFCSLEIMPIYILHDLYVLPNYRNLGVGRSLLKHVEKIAKQNNAIRVDLTTANNNHIAQNLYRSLGWEKDEIFYTYSLNLGIHKPRKSK